MNKMVQTPACRTAMVILSFFLVFACSLTVLPGTVQGQDRQLILTSNADSAGVWVDGAWMGTVEDAPFMIASTARQVVVRPPGNDIWSINPLHFDLGKETADAITLDAAFEYHYRIESIPSGAHVFLGETGVGITPTTHRTPEPLQEMIRLELEGYKPGEVEPGQNLWNHVSTTMEPLPSLAEAVRSDHVVSGKGPNWVNIAVTASAFAAGALAVHYRTKADNRFDDYGVTGKESLRSDIRRLDVQSGVALGVMQAGLGFVAIRLAL